METGILLCVAMVLLIIWAYKHVSSHRTLGNQIPGPSGLPMLGSTLKVNLSKIHLSFYDWALQYGKIFKVSIFGQGIVVINDLSLMKKAFVDDVYAANFCNHPQSVIGKHVVYDNGDIAFSLKYDKTFVTLKKMFSKALRKYSEESKAFEKTTQEEIGRFLDCIHEYKGADFEAKPLIRRSFGNLMSIILSGELPGENDSEMIWQFNDSVFYIAENSVSLLLKFLPFLRHIRQLKCGRLFQKVIEQRDLLEDRYYHPRKDRLDGEGEYGLVDTLLKLQKEENKKAGFEIIKEENIKSLLLDITAGGMTSTTNAITAAIGLLVNHPECAEKIQAEIDDVIGHNRLPSAGDRSKMDFMMAFTYETLRYISHGSIGLPHEVARDHAFEGYHMKKNDIVFSNIWYINRDPALWDDPWSFQPERFLDASGKLVPSNHVNRQNLITFSLGRHSCPGSDFSIGKIFLYVTSILQTFNIVPPSKHGQTPLDPRNFLPGLFLEPDDYFLRMTPRS